MDDLGFFWEEPEAVEAEDSEEEEQEEEEEEDGSENEGDGDSDGLPASEIGLDELPSECGDKGDGEGPANPNPELPVSTESTTPMPVAPLPEPGSPPCVIPTATSKPGGVCSPPPPATPSSASAASGMDPLITPPPKGFQPLDVTPEAVQVS